MQMPNVQMYERILTMYGMLQEYEKILHSRDGLAIVTIKDNSCGGCHMLVPPQVINLIKMYEHIVTCEVCNRILYIKE